jgi:hypothetical protein
MVDGWGNAGAQGLSATVAKDERDDGHDQKDHEKNFGDAGSASGDAAKAENRRDQGDNEKDEGVMQHAELLIRVGQPSCKPWVVVTATPIAAMDSVYEAVLALLVGQAPGLW